nr:MAG TPA: hypothetical protein [Caudoviricetes sp.]
MTFPRKNPGKLKLFRGFQQFFKREISEPICSSYKNYSAKPQKMSNTKMFKHV